MPTGNHHLSPPGIWWQEPQTSSIPRLLFRSARQIGCLAFVIYLGQKYRSMSWNYTYTNFLGKTTVFGQKTRLKHEPLSAEEIDKLKKGGSKII